MWGLPWSFRPTCVSGGLMLALQSVIRKAAAQEGCDAVSSLDVKMCMAANHKET